MEKKSYIESKKSVIYTRKNLMLIVRNIIMSKITAITLKTIEKLLICFESKIQNTKRSSVVSHNGSTNDCNFTIIEIAVEFKGQFECLG